MDRLHSMRGDLRLGKAEVTNSETKAVWCKADDYRQTVSSKGDNARRSDPSSTDDCLANVHCDEHEEQSPRPHAKRGQVRQEM